MRLVLTILIVVTAWGLVGSKAFAVVPDTAAGHYQAIPDRNVFGLRPPPAQPGPSNAPVALPKITLTGITTILGNKRALMKVAPAGLKVGDPNKEQSLILTEGQREADIEVLEIDEIKGSVKVKNSGTVMLLTFEKDGAKLPSSVPGATAVPGALPGPAGVHPNVTMPALPTNFQQHLPARARRGNGLPGGGPAGLTGSAPSSVPTPTGLSAPPAQASSQPEQELTPEEQAIVIELQRQATAGESNLPPLPPTMLNPSAGQSVETTAPGTGLTLPATGRSPGIAPQ